MFSLGHITHFHLEGASIVRLYSEINDAAVHRLPLLSGIIMREPQTKDVWRSLMLIIVGVGITTFTELSSFDVIGLISALIATMGFSLQNIFYKKVHKETGVYHSRLLYILGRLALFMILPVWIYVDLFNVMKHPSNVTSDYRLIVLLFADGALNLLYNKLAFNVIINVGFANLS